MNLTPNPLTGNASVKFASRAAKIRMQIDTVAATPTATEANVIALLAALTGGSGVDIELVKRHGSYGTKTVLYKNKAVTYMEIAAANEGHVRITDVATKARIVGTIELSENGSIVPIEGEEYELTITGLSTTYTASLNLIDLPGEAYSMLQYSPVNVLGTAPTSINVIDATLLAIPKTNLTLVELEFVNGQKVAWLPAELEQVANELNEISIVAGGLIIPGGYGYYTIPVSSAVRAFITTSAASLAFVVKEFSL